MLVSILIPVYNVEKYIGRCAYSLFQQTYDNIEYIFVNDCSPDRSIEVLRSIIEEFPNRKKKVKIIEHQTNKGLSAARNTALENASGEYVMHVDSDDYIDPQTVELALRKADAEQSDIVVFDMSLIYNDVTTYSSAMVVPDKNKYLNSILCRDSAVCLCGGLYRKRLYTDNNIHAIDGLNYGEDYVTKPRLVYYANKVSHLQLPLYKYVQYNASSYTQNVKATAINDILKAIDILVDFFRTRHSNFHQIENMIKIRNKVFLLEYCERANRKFVYSLFNEISDVDLQMPLKHRIVWTLSSKKCYRLMSLYIDIAKFLKRQFHI